MKLAKWISHTRGNISASKAEPFTVSVGTDVCPLHNSVKYCFSAKLVVTQPYARLATCQPNLERFLLECRYFEPSTVLSRAGAKRRNCPRRYPEEERQHPHTRWGVFSEFHPPATLAASRLTVVPIIQFPNPTWLASQSGTYFSTWTNEVWVLDGRFSATNLQVSLLSHKFRFQKPLFYFVFLILFFFLGATWLLR